MSLLTIDEFEATVRSGADPDMIQDVIDREEAELEHALLGPLVGERTQTIHPGSGYDGPLFLMRFTDEVDVTDDDVAVAVRLLMGGGAIERTTGAWSGTVAVTYTPNDELRVRRALIELVRDVIVPDRDREAGTSRPDVVESSERRRQRLVRSLRPRVGHTTLVVRPVDRVTPADPFAEAVGS